MPTIRLHGALVSYSLGYRLRLADGRRVFMTWHDYCGPLIFKDKAERREFDKWYEDPLICEAIQWFVNRGCKA